MDAITQLPVHALIVEDEPVARPVLEGLAADPDECVTVEWAADLASAVERLTHGGIDVVLLSLTLPDSGGLITFERAHFSCPMV